MPEIALPSNRHTTARRFWLWWIAACAVVTVIHSLTLKTDPLMYQDEVQVLEYGRTALEPETDWGVIWNVNEAIPILTPAYLGPALQELGYRITAPSTFGSRMVAVMAGVLAATCLLAWFLARGTPRLAAFILSLALLIDPIFAANYRGGRVDGWSFAACLAACFLLRLAGKRRQVGLPISGLLIGAGALSGLSPFFWPNAPILWPLILLELVCLLLVKPDSSVDDRLRESLKILSLMALGGMVAVAVVILPALPHWSLWWNGLLTVAEVQAFAAVIQVSIIEQFAIRDPIVVIGALLAVVVCRDWGLLIAFGLALVIVYQTMVYLPRMMYLLPYFLAMIASASCAVHAPNAGRKLARLAMNRVIAAVIIWNAGVTLVYRPALAAYRWPATDASQLVRELERAIGRGPYRVLTEEWSAYPAGRELGWRQYHSGTAYNRAKYLELLESMDYLVLREVPLWQHTLELVDDAGFELQETIYFAQSKPVHFSVAHLEFKTPPASYHSISVYRKSDPDTMEPDPDARALDDQTR